LFKKTKKKVSVLIVLAMVLTMLVGFGAPAAASTAIDGVVVGNVPTIVSTGNVTLASIRYAETTPGNLQTGNTIEVTLPSGITFQDVADTDYYEASSNLTVAVAKDIANRKITFTLTRTSLLSAASLLIQIPANQTATAPTSGNVTATVTTNTTAVNGGSFNVGVYGTGSLAISSPTTTIPTVGRFVGTGQAVRTVRLKENAPGALKSLQANKLVLTLPAGATWAAAPATTTVGVSVYTEVDTTDARKLNVWTNAATTVATTFDILTPSVMISRLAVLGDLVVTVTGEGTNAGVSGSLVVANVADFAITVALPTSTDPTNVTAGRASQPLAGFEIKESTPGSLINGGTVDVTLPEGYQWAAFGASASLQGSGGATIGTDSIVANSGNRTARFSVTAASTANTTITITGSVHVSPTAVAGDVVVTVGGTASAEGTVVPAKARRVADVTASSVTGVRIAVTDQAAGDIVITEAAGGRLVAGNLVLTLPTGVTFNGTPTVTKTSGNITLGTVTAVGDTLTINISAAGTVASVITVSGVKYNVDRLVPDGNINVTVNGPAIVDNTVAGLTTAFPSIKVFNARIGAAGSTVFTISSTSYVIDGNTYTMDVAPFIQDGRTFLPLRFAAEAVGTQEIIWDSVRKTVTLIRGDRVVQVTIGSTTMLINGAAITMDVAPVIVDGRTMLPIRWVGMALRANVDWDAVARTVTVSPY